MNSDDVEFCSVYLIVSTDEHYFVSRALLYVLFYGSIVRCYIINLSELICTV